jgi:hypothetical protein
MHEEYWGEHRNLHHAIKRYIKITKQTCEHTTNFFSYLSSLQGLWATPTYIWCYNFPSDLNYLSSTTSQSLSSYSPSHSKGEMRTCVCVCVCVRVSGDERGCLFFSLLTNEKDTWRNLKHPPSSWEDSDEKDTGPLVWGMIKPWDLEFEEGHGSQLLFLGGSPFPQLTRARMWVVGVLLVTI